MTNNKQEFREFCDKIHAAHPAYKRFAYHTVGKKLYLYTGQNEFFSLQLSPDFGPDDLKYTVEPPYEWKVPKEGQISVKAFFFYENSWFKGIIIGWYLGKAIFFETEDCIRLVSLDKLVLADPKNPDRKPDDNWGPE